MQTQIFTDNDWLFPDSPITKPGNSVELATARGAGASFQLLTDLNIAQTARVELIESFSQAAGLRFFAYQLLPVRVEENSGAELYTTLDYEKVKHFVSRQAPFYVFDANRSIQNGQIEAGRIGFFFRVEADASASPGLYQEKIKISCAGQKIEIAVTLQVHRAQVPPVQKARFFQSNWLKLEPLAEHYFVQYGSSSFWELVKKHLENLVSLRNTHLQLPTGKPVYNAAGQLIDFDFSECEIIGNLALQSGFRYIYGGFVARFTQWDHQDHFLLWDRQVSVTSIEGYRQLSIYFKRVLEQVEKNGWQASYQQGLVDEPQFPNSASYRALGAICRKFLPGMTIIDPVETSNIAGALDIWVIKQSVYEEHRVEFDQLADLGEELWVYTCGFPAGKVMNRATDLPLLAGRLVAWQSYLYRLKGFLHWGYNAYNPGRDPYMYNCFASKRADDNQEYLLPPGNGFIVYPGSDGPRDSVRSHGQRSAAEEAELLYQLADFNQAEADALAGSLCRSFSDYETDTSKFATVRQNLLVALDRYLPG